MNNVKKAALVFGVIFVIIGILGFIPAFTPNGHLLGIFEVNGLHNMVHLLSGIAALVASKSYRNSRLYFQIFGIIYGLVALLGVFYGDHAIFGVLAHNIADLFLHIIITAAALYLGFGTPSEDSKTTDEV